MISVVDLKEFPSSIYDLIKKNKYTMRELRIAVLGNVDAGKSSLTGVLTKNVLDDGRGYARSLVSQFTHEKETGKTSSVTQNFSKDDGGNVVVYIDLAGHEKYLKTTLHGMTGFFPDYAMVVVGGNMGVTDITKEHINVAIALNVPFMIVITKVDIAPAHVMERTKKNIEEIIRDRLKRKTAVYMTRENVETLTQLRRWIPIFEISNKTGDGIDLLRRYIHYVQGFFAGLLAQKPQVSTSVSAPIPAPQTASFHLQEDMKDCSVFSVDRSYQVNGVGTVLSGQVCNGGFKKNDIGYLGPFHGVWHPVTVRSFHDNFQTGIEKMDEGESGCIAIKCLTKGVDMKKLAFRKGIYLMSSEKCKRYTTFDFEADVFIMHTHSTSINRNYQPVINCNKIVQTAKIVDICPIDDSLEKDKTQAHTQSISPVPYKRPLTSTIRAGDKCRIHFRFNHRPEFIQENDKFIFREGQTRGIGIIRKVMTTFLALQRGSEGSRESSDLAQQAISSVFSVATS
jgi:elongation factor 1-alpha